jgi:hypothetical protein
MPVKAWIDFARVIIGEDAVREEVSHADASTVVPVTHVLDTSAHFNAQASVHLPRIINIHGSILICHVADGSRVALRIARNISNHEVRIRIVRRPGVDTRDNVWLLPAEAADASIRTHSIVTLQVARVLRVRTDLDGVRAKNLREAIRKARNLFPNQVVPVRLKPIALREVRERIRSTRAVRRNQLRSSEDRTIRITKRALIGCLRIWRSEGKSYRNPTLR